MPLSLTCDCGARFEVEDALAGQTVSCPECQQPLKAPSVQRPTVRTSGFALASFLLALVGAFTVVGTIAAVILGVVAVVGILRDRERVAGLCLASFGIGLGLVFTTLTLWAFTTGDLFGIGSSMRRFQMADQLEPADPKAPLESKENGFSLPRPSFRWLKAKKEFQDLLIEPLLQKDAVLLLVRPDANAFVDVQAEAGGRIAFFEETLVDQLRPPPGAAQEKDQPNLPGGDADGARPPAITDVHVFDREDNLPADGTGADQIQNRRVEFNLGGKPWTLLARAYQAGGKLYILRAYTESARYPRLKDEFVKMLDGFKVTPGS